MPWIRVVEESQATGELQATYERIADRRGKVANILKVHSLLPATMQGHLDFYLSLQFGNAGVSRRRREMIAVAVSAQNGCEYCLRHHGEALNHYWKDEAKVERFARDLDAVALDEADRAMLDYSLKLTRSPAEVEEADVARLRAAGFTDEQVLSVNLVAAYFNFVNRVALGLGVPFSPDEIKGYKH